MKANPLETATLRLWKPTLMPMLRSVVTRGGAFLCNVRRGGSAAAEGSRGENRITVDLEAKQ